MSWPRRRRREPAPQWWLDVLNSLSEGHARRAGLPTEDITDPAPLSKAQQTGPDQHGRYDSAALDADQYAPDAQPRTREVTRSGWPTHPGEAHDDVVDLDPEPTAAGECATCGIPHTSDLSCRDAWSVALARTGEDLLRSASLSGHAYDRPTLAEIDAALEHQHQRDELGPWRDGFHTPECSRRRGSPLCSCPTQPHETQRPDARPDDAAGEP